MSKLENILRNSDEDKDMEKALTKIAELLASPNELEELMLLTRANNEDIVSKSLLYAINETKLRRPAIRKFLSSYFSLMNSKGGESRKEMIQVVKANTGELPKGFLQKIRERF